MVHMTGKRSKFIFIVLFMSKVHAFQGLGNAMKTVVWYLLRGEKLTHAPKKKKKHKILFCHPSVPLINT